jgi:flagellin-like protein
MRIRKKAVSPVVSTVLLILIVFIIAIIIIVWSRGFIRETITKEIAGEKKTVEQFCTEVGLQPILNEIDGSFGVKNIGNVPIYALSLRLAKGGTKNVVKLTGDNGLVNPGFSKIIKGYNYATDGWDEIKVAPIIIGKTKSGDVNEFECPETDGVKI